MKNTHIYIALLLMHVSVVHAAIEDLNEMEDRKLRRGINTYYTGESSYNNNVRQPESLMYKDTTTGNEVWIMSNTSNKASVYYADISPANPWSADGSRLGFFSTRPISEFKRNSGSNMGSDYVTPFVMRSDGSHIRVTYEGSCRTWGTNGMKYFYWNPSVRDIYYTTGDRSNGLSLEGNAIYKNVVSDTAISYAKLIQLPGAATDSYDLGKTTSPDGGYILPKKGTYPNINYYPTRIYPEDQKHVLDPDGWNELRGQTNQWGGGQIFGCRHDIYFPSPNFFVLLFSEDCARVTPVFYKYNLIGSAVDGGPYFSASETSFSPFNSKEVEPLWTSRIPNVPWKLENVSDDKHFWGHPGFDRWGRIVIYADGNAYWADASGKPSSEKGGPVAWDYVNRKLVAEPIGTIKPQPLVQIEKAVTYVDFSAWSDYFAFALNGESSTYTESQRMIRTAEYNKTANNGNDYRPVALHYANKNNSTFYVYTSNARVAQSPDGTKISYAVTFLTDTPNAGDLAYAVAYYPHPPEVTSVTKNNGAYIVRFDWRTDQTVSRGYTQRGWPNEATNTPPPPRETKLFRLWRSPNGVDGWEPVEAVNADIFERYDFSTGAWNANKYWEVSHTPEKAGTWYFAVTSQEWSGLESRTLSNVFSGDGIQATGYPADPKGIKPFYTSAPPWPTNPESKLIAPGQYRLNWQEPNDPLIRYYNIYYSKNNIPKPIREQRIASVPKGTKTYVDWLADSNTEGYYLITSVDSQGNESSHDKRRGIVAK